MANHADEQIRGWASFLTILKSRNLLPKQIQISKWNCWHIYSAFDYANSEFISESIAMGISPISLIAEMKAITEFCERSGMRSSTDPVTFLTKRSDGFAAFPSYELNSTLLARKNALNEAVERYLWAKWWDDPQIRHTLKSKKCLSEFVQISLNALESEFRLRQILVLSIKEESNNFELIILVAFLENNGVLTGGECNVLSSTDAEVPGERAFGELLRHLLAFERMKGKNDSDLTFYERRLFGFGSGKFGEVALDRLNANGNEHISLPRLIVDKRISHVNEDIITIHRCLFENQPVFMGGQIDRLCL